ncbi:hypothetical protein TeGR_g11775 [Tetraparma gracilis]|uniref:non-specific serine/threonine protein kinase n=1 Tax=Tetraparma gracilis TaxID=2962635 RepID=A0ABQ6MSZ5_9STRA|nr:hypothetical protein TeGR_g11775 [Tetraparma gracilis]
MDLPRLLSQLLNLLLSLCISLLARLQSLVTSFFPPSPGSSYGPVSTSPPQDSSSLPAAHDLRSVPLSFPSLPPLSASSLVAEGGFSFVYRVSHASGEYALKQIILQSPEIERDAERERTLHESYCAGHPNLLPLVSSISRHPSPSGLPYALLLFPFHPRSLASLLCAAPSAAGVQPLPPTSPASVSRYARGVLSALLHLHSHSLAHLDLKAHNVLVSASDVPVLMDLGSCRPNGPSNAGLPTSRASLLSAWTRASSESSATHRAPELWQDSYLSGSPLDLRLCDVFSFGALLYALHFGASPFESTLVPGGVRYADTSNSSVLSTTYRRGPGFGGEVGERWRAYVEGGWEEVANGCMEGDRERRWTGERAWEALGGGDPEGAV